MIGSLTFTEYSCRSNSASRYLLSISGLMYVFRSTASALSTAEIGAAEGIGTSEISDGSRADRENNARKQY